MKTIWQDGFSLALSNVLLLIACAIFASGFFPYKPFLPGLAEYDTKAWGPPPDAPFDKVVFMVVDALRSDFVFGNESGFAFTQSLIRKGFALPFTAHATAPTVTMPRVKAITTGSIPSFLDMILNFAESDTTSSLAHQDTWLAQMKAKDTGKLIMYGDDTWLKLFPDTFDRADGTSSFFVSDFTEVDNNVTRHVPDELKNEDWSVMIMHYLGMDHIGHRAGPRSVNMIPKQQEMDGIVEQIYTAIESSPHLSSTLFVMCGDHGMNDGGNHGGSAPGETSPALVLMSPKFGRSSRGLASPATPKGDFEYYTKIEQSDIAPTLAGLLGFPIPRNNLGVFIAQLLPLWTTDRDRIQLLLQNAAQMLEIAKVTFPHEFWENLRADMHCKHSTSSADKLACAWREVLSTLRSSRNGPPPAEMILPFLVYFCKTAQELLSSTASNYNLTSMLAGIGLATTSVLLCIYTSWRQIIEGSHNTATAFTCVTILYGIMQFASSYVEEEQQFWYWICSGWFVILALTRYRHVMNKTWLEFFSTVLRTFLPLLALRLLRRWNQSGQKYAGAPDISSFFLAPEWQVTLWSLGIYNTYLLLWRRIFDSLRHVRMPTSPAACLSAIVCAESLQFKMIFAWNEDSEAVHAMFNTNFLFAWLPWQGTLERDLVSQARWAYFWIGASAIVVIVLGRTRTLHLGRTKESRQRIFTLLFPSLTAFLLMQTRINNIPVFLLFEVLDSTILSRMDEASPPTLSITLSTLLLSHVSYFALGGTNAISSLDLSQAYNGVAAYNAPIVGLLLFVGNWAGPIYWSMNGLNAALISAAEEDATVVAAKKAATPQKSAPNSLSNSSTTAISTSTPSMWHAYTQHNTLLTSFVASATLSTMLACTALRTHLFVWTVFSPKFLYAVGWLVGWHFLVNLGLGAVAVALE